MKVRTDFESNIHVDNVLIGTPVGHSLSPVMHRALYNELAKHGQQYRFWTYEAIECPTEQDAKREIELVRTGRYRGMNITMPYKRLALRMADYVDPSADIAGGANVLVRKGLDLYAYNTDGLGAVGAIENAGGVSVQGKTACVCGTGPTALAIACALANAQAGEVIVFSRSMARARSCVDRVGINMPDEGTCRIRAAQYEQAGALVPGADIFIDATPRGMQAGDAAIVPTEFFGPGQLVMDVVYGHGETALLAGARAQGATCMDGLEMLVEQAALSVEIWADALGLALSVDRAVLREAARGENGGVK